MKNKATSTFPSMPEGAPGAGPSAVLPRTRTRAWVLPVALSLMLGLSGCPATMDSLVNNFPGASQAPLSPAEQQMQEDSDRFNKTVFAGVLTGAAAGAAGGALIAILGGGNKKDAVKGGVIGGVVGATALGIDAYVTAKKEQAGRQRISALNAAASDLNQENARLQNYIASSSQVLADGRARLVQLRSDVKASKVSTDQAEAARSREEKNIENMKATLAQAQQTRNEYAEAARKLPANNADRAKFQQEIQTMEKQIATLEKNIADYSTALSVSRA